MKFALTLCFATCFIASLQTAAVADEDATTTVAAEVANDYFSECFHVRYGGHCSGQSRRYTFNANTRRCEEFGGCGGNRNNFKSKAACEATCFRYHNEEANDESSTTAKAGANDEVAPVIPAEEEATVA